jgi:broad specificity phosphatase PhoE
MYIYLVRHAKTVIDPQKNSEYWALDTNATKEIQDLVSANDYDRVDKIISSAERKAVETAKILSKSVGKPFEIIKDINEVKRGGFVDDYDETVKLFFANPKKSIVEWETASSALKRTQMAITHILEKEDSHCVAVVGQGLIFSLLRAHWLGLSKVNFSDWQTMKMPDISIWKFSEKQIQLVQDFGELA